MILTWNLNLQKDIELTNFFKFVLLLCISTFTFADNSYLPKSSIIESKTIDGTKYNIVQANADIVDTFTADGKPIGTFSLVYANLAGKVAVSKKEYKHIPNAHHDKITIYYLIKEGEEGKQSHEVIFKRENIRFPVYSRDKDNKNYTKDIPYEYKSRVNYDGVYPILFMLFLTLSSFFDNRNVSFIPIKIRLFIQAVIIIIFFIGVNKVINIENDECSQSIIHTKGTVRYFLNDEPYVIFKNCNGDNSQSQMNIEALKGYNEYAPIDIYYSQETQEGSVDNRGHTFNYKVYFSEEEFSEKSEMLLRTKVGFFMLLLWLYFFFNYKKKLTLPSSILKRNDYFKVDPYSEKYSELLSKIPAEEYDNEHYDTNYKIYTDKKKRINLKRTNIYALVVPAIVAAGVLWVLSRLLSGILAVPTEQTREFYGFTIAAFFFGAAFLFVAIKNIRAIKHIGIFDNSARRYEAFDYDKNIPFNKIYGLIILHKRVRISGAKRIYYKELFILDLLLKNGEIINLMANEDRDILLHEATIISSYIQKPIFDLGKWDYRKVKNIYTDTQNKKSNP